MKGDLHIDMLAKVLLGLAVAVVLTAILLYVVYPSALKAFGDEMVAALFNMFGGTGG